MLTLLALDLWTYWWHRFNHTVPFLWRFHRAHHTDTEMGATTAYRFHPVERLDPSRASWSFVSAYSRTVRGHRSLADRGVDQGGPESPSA
ncbi:MAG TPA: sterol desaturase family protein [Spirochaetia bacterium]|nr:sterol desaturase family protein [Spirochaetia bacterium]